MKATAIVILNYNNYEDTINCIESVQQYNTADIKLFVVDNGSPRKECLTKIDNYLKGKFERGYIRIRHGEPTLNQYPKATFIVSEVNDGYACGNNKALEYIKNDKDIEYVLILNNDILFIQDIIPMLVQNLNNLPNAAIVSPLLLKKDGKSIDYNCARKACRIEFLTKKYWNWMFRKTIKMDNSRYILKINPNFLDYKSLKIDLPSGSCMLIKKSLFNDIGWFDPNTFLYYEEDILYQKVSKIGLQNYLIPFLRCIHLGAQSTSKSIKKRNYKQFMIYSRSERYYVKFYCKTNNINKILYSISFACFALYKYIIDKTLKIID